MIEIIGRFVRMIRMMGIIVRIMLIAILFCIGSHDTSSYSLALGASIGKNVPWLLG